VTTTNNSGPGSLRQAILDANSCPGTNTIEFSPSAYGTILLTSGELLITDHLFIHGPGATNVAVDGNVTSRVFHIGSNTLATIAGVTITNGSANAFGAVVSGGGIFNENATLTVSNCTVSGNHADTGGGLFNSATAGSAHLLIVNSTVSGNGAVVGGGIHTRGSSSGVDSLGIVNMMIITIVCDH